MGGGGGVGGRRRREGGGRDNFPGVLKCLLWGLCQVLGIFRGIKNMQKY